MVCDGFRVKSCTWGCATAAIAHHARLRRKQSIVILVHMWEVASREGRVQDSATRGGRNTE